MTGHSRRTKSAWQQIVVTLSAGILAPSLAATVASADSRTHDGFYLRLGGGFAYMSDAAEVEGRFGGSGEGTLTAGGVAYELARLDRQCLRAGAADDRQFSLANVASAQPRGNRRPEFARFGAPGALSRHGPAL